MVEKELFIATQSVECTFQRKDLIVVIGAVFREYHNLCEIDETAKFLVLHTGVHSVVRCFDTVFTVWLLYFDKRKRNAIEQGSNIRSKFIGSVRIGQLRYNGKGVFHAENVIIINQLDAVVPIQQDRVKCSSNIIIVEYDFQFRNKPFCSLDRGIYSLMIGS